jgi:hypothetical protein
MSARPTPAIDYPRLLRARLVVARAGEMDLLGWWNTKGVLGKLGASVYLRGFPRTASFAQARVVFAVASARARELWSPPGCATLWNLPPDIEDAFEDHWQAWADAPEVWAPVFDVLTRAKGELLDELRAVDAITAPQAEAARDLKRSLDGRAVLLPGVREVNDDTLALLAAGFFRGEKGAPAIPYARLEA